MRWLLSALLGFIVFSHNSYAGCTFKVRGYLKVKSQLSEYSDNGDLPLENVTVKVYGSSVKPYVWNKWGETTTTGTGFFKVHKDKSGGACNNGRYIKVEARFESDEFEVRHEESTQLFTVQVKDYIVKKATSKLLPEEVGFGSLVFKSGGLYDLGADEPRWHADIWKLYKDVIEHMKDKGSDFEFTKKFAVKYPHDGIAPDVGSNGTNLEANYANPITQVIYIIKNSRLDGFNVGTLLHELMHIWAYQHSTGESHLAEYLVFHGSTHGLVNDSDIAFHEGFADYAQRQMRNELFGTDLLRPYNRSTMKHELGLNNMDEVQRHDDGWSSILQGLGQEDLELYSYLDASTDSDLWRITEAYTNPFNCSHKKIKFDKVLSSFNAHSDKGLYDQIDNSEMNLDDFLDRLSTIYSKFDTEEIDAHSVLLDPNETRDPKDFFCDSLVAQEEFRTDFSPFLGFQF